MTMNVLYISGSPRKKNSNSDYLLNLARNVTGGEFIKLINYYIEPCKACWGCQKRPTCLIDDDMKNIITPMLLKVDAIVIGSPVYFNNVSAQLKSFIDRTWSLKGVLKNKIGGAVVAGKGYGSESAITAIHAFFLKHDMIPANRGVCGIGFKTGDVKIDSEAVKAATCLGERILELGRLLQKTGGGVMDRANEVEGKKV